MTDFDDKVRAIRREIDRRVRDDISRAQAAMPVDLNTSFTLWRMMKAVDDGITKDTRT